MTPLTRMTVTSATIRNAGRLNTIGTPNRCGAVVNADADCSTVSPSDAVFVPFATASATFAAA